MRKQTPVPDKKEKDVNVTWIRSAVLSCALYSLSPLLIRLVLPSVLSEFVSAVRGGSVPRVSRIYGREHAPVLDEAGEA